MGNPFDPGYYRTDELRGLGFKAIGENVAIAKNCTIIGLHHIEIGDHVRIDGFTSVVATGPFVIRSFVHIHTGCVIGSRGGVTFEDYAVISHGCRILSASDDYGGQWMIGSVAPVECVSPTVAPVRLERHAAVGCGSTILPGVTLHEGAALLAHSIAHCSLPEWTVNAGAPAVFKRDRSRRIQTLMPMMAGQVA